MSIPQLSENAQLGAISIHASQNISLRNFLFALCPMLFAQYALRLAYPLPPKPHKKTINSVCPAKYFCLNI